MKDYSMPFQVGWDVIHKCNFRCRHCYFSSEQLSDPQCLSKADALQFVEQLVKGKVFHLSIAGGEPLLYPHLLDVVRSASLGGLTVSISTNASLLSVELATALRSAGAATLQISLDGHCREINDRIRGKGSFDRTVAGILNAKATGFQILLAIVLVRHNIDHITEYVEFARHLGVSGIKVQTLLRSGLGDTNYAALALDRDQVLDVLRELWKVKRARHVPLNLILPPVESEHGNSGCIGCKPGISTIRVNSAGDVRACGSDVNAKAIGNVSVEGLADIWRSSRELIQIRNIEAVGDGRSPTACGTSCGSACKSRSSLALSGALT